MKTIESQVLELTTEALEAFCEDMSGMFGMEMSCEQQEIATQTVAGLKKSFKKLVAVNIVDSEGALDGTFQIILDQEGLFTLGGVMVMLPEKRILANRKDASVDLAESMVDAVGEAGNLLVGAWERIFREELEGHGHLTQRLPAYVGKPWKKPTETIGLAADEELVFIPYEMTIAPYPAFKCGVIFPKTIFAGKPAEEADPEPAEEKPEAKTKAKTKTKPEVVEEEPEAAAEPAPEPEAAAETPADEVKAEAVEKEPKAAAEPEPEELADSSIENRKSKIENDEEPEAAADGAEEEAESKEPAMGPVSEAIQEMAQPPSIVPSEPAKPALAKNAALGPESELLWICASDIMQDQVVWASPEDSVQQALAKMQQHDVGYILVGLEGALEGILSKSDAAGAISPYLRPMFAKWRRPSDEATLKIKIKHVMSRPVRTATPETPLATMMENMCRFSGRALPVVDGQGKVCGLVTAFDIFQMLLNTGANVPTAGKTSQGPPLA